MNSKVLLLVLFALFSFSAVNAQIVPRKIADSQPTPAVSYDASRNFLGDDVYQYVGQELYLKAKSEELRRFGYDGFIRDYAKSVSINPLFMMHKSNIYECCSEQGSHSDYKRMTGRYFKVLDVVPHPKGKTDSIIYGKKYFLKLQAKDTGDIVFYEYDAQFEHRFPFLTVGFYNQEKRRLVGKQFVVRGDNWIKYGDPMTDINTGKAVDFGRGSVWQCVDLTIAEKFFNLALILQNQKQEQIFISYDFAFHPYHHWIFDKDQADQYRSRFGDNIWNLILAGEVVLGMTKEMCRLSWGTPKYVNNTKTRSGRRHQWVYDTIRNPRSYLYFDDDRLVSIEQ